MKYVEFQPGLVEEQEAKTRISKWESFAFATLVAVLGYAYWHTYIYVPLPPIEYIYPNVSHKPIPCTGEDCDNLIIENNTFYEVYYGNTCYNAAPACGTSSTCGSNIIDFGHNLIYGSNGGTDYVDMSGHCIIER